MSAQAATNSGQLSIGNAIFGTAVSGTGTTAATHAKIGIKNTSPKAVLDVTGDISVSGVVDVGHTALACSTAISGSIRYETTSDTLQICTSAGWKSLTSGTTAAGSTSAASSTGAVQFNSGNSFAGDGVNLFWDDANNRLGIGTASPQSKFNVAGNSGVAIGAALTGDNAFTPAAAGVVLSGANQSGKSTYASIGNATALLRHEVGQF